MTRFGSVEHEVADHVARVTTDRPEKRNALDDELLERDADARAGIATLRTIEAGYATVDQIAAEVAAVPREALNTALDVMGGGAMSRCHGQLNAPRRLG
jgi:hypothetical protein